MALALTLLPAPNGADNSQRRTMTMGTGKLSGSYTAGGEAINWATLAGTSGGDAQINTLPPPTPVWVEFQIGIPGSTPLWFGAQYNYTTGKLQFYATGAAGGDGFAELAASTYPADLTAGTLYFKAEFPAE